MKCLIKNIVIGFAMLIVLGMYLHTALAATIWTEQAGQFYKYDKTPNNLTDTSWDYALTGDLESIGAGWIKQDGVFMLCKSGGGANRYYPIGYDCSTGKPKLTPVPIIPLADALHCANEGQSCTIPTVLTANVWYGARDKWVLKQGVSGVIQCNNTAFGKDPAVGVSKSCLYKQSVAPTVPTAPVGMTCAKYICHTEFGEIIIVPELNTVETCPAFKIINGVAKSFDGLQEINGKRACPQGTYEPFK